MFSPVREALLDSNNWLVKVERDPSRFGGVNLTAKIPILTDQDLAVGYDAKGDIDDFLMDVRNLKLAQWRMDATKNTLRPVLRGMGFNDTHIDGMGIDGMAREIVQRLAAMVLAKP